MTVPTSRPSRKTAITAATHGSTKDTGRPRQAGPRSRATAKATAAKGTVTRGARGEVSRAARGEVARGEVAQAAAAKANAAKASATDSTGKPQPAPGRVAGRVAGRAAVVSLVSVRLPVVHARVPMLRLHPPEATAAQTRWMAQAVRANLPSTERLLYYGGLAALAAIGVLEWPVAAAVGAGVWVAARTGQRSTATRAGGSGAHG